MKGRAVAAGLWVVSFGYLLQARDFRATFIADPIGPSAFPYGLGVLLLLSCTVLVLRPTAMAIPRLSWRHAAIVAAMLAYCATLRTLGFVVSTTTLSLAVVVLFGGPWRRGLVLSLALCVALFALFTYGLSVPLPVGRVFGGR